MESGKSWGDPGKPNGSFFSLMKGSKFTAEGDGGDDGG